MRTWKQIASVPDETEKAVYLGKGTSQRRDDKGLLNYGKFRLLEKSE